MAKTVKTVAMLIAKYYPEMGGVERQLRLLSRELEKNGIQVLIITRNYHKGPTREVIDQSKVRRSPVFGKSRALHSLSFILFGLLILFKHARKIDVIHCHQTYSPMTIGTLAGLLLRKPVMVKVTASNEFGEVNELKRLPFFRVRFWLMQRVKHFFTVNRTTITELKSLGIDESRCLWLPNGVAVPIEKAFVEADQRRFREDLDLHKEAKIVVYSGRLSAEKGLLTLVRAWKKAQAKLPQNTLLLIFGEAGVHRGIGEELKALIQDLGISASVRLMGRVENVYPYLLAADAFTLLSVSEGMSNSLLEAMACGLPSLATDIAGNRELINDHQEGLLVPVGDIEKTAAALTEILLDTKKAWDMGKNARLKIEHSFDISMIAAKVMEAYVS